jgi:hypothetical protein
MPYKDPERAREAHRAYYQKNKARHSATMKAWYAKNRERHLAKTRARRAENRSAWLRYMSAANVRRNYGLTPQDRLELFESSDGLCALCYEVPATTIDHDHETGRVRGALCHRCNAGLGWVEAMGATSSSIQEYLSTDWRAA